MTITAERLRELLRYDPETGVFHWLKTGSGKRLDLVAGSFKPGGYVFMWIDGKSFYAHRLAFLYMEGALPPEDVDHINRCKSDNSWLNLRKASRSQNLQNATKPKTNTSGFKGVSWIVPRRKWRAQIQLGTCRRELGVFDTPEEAHAAYIDASRELFGEFARAN
jgi:hypothetical protein